MKRLTYWLIVYTIYALFLPLRAIIWLALEDGVLKIIGIPFVVVQLAERGEPIPEDYDHPLARLHRWANQKPTGGELSEPKEDT